MTLLETKTIELAKIYQSFAKKRGDYRNYISSKTPTQSKNWKYFEEAYQNLSKEPNFDPYIFIEAQFRNLEKNKTLFPAQLKTKAAMERYKEHRESLKVQDGVSNTEKIMISLANTKKLIIKWWKQHGNKGDYDSLFKIQEGEFVSDGFSYCIQGMISKYFMSISKSFNYYYKSLDPDIKYEIIDPKELKKYRVTLKLNDEAWQFAKEVFGSEVA